MDSDSDSGSDTYHQVYGVQLLDDIHNYMPALLYNADRFRTIGDVLSYIGGVAEEHNAYEYHESMAAWSRRLRGRTVESIHGPIRIPPPGSETVYLDSDGEPSFAGISQNLTSRLLGLRPQVSLLNPFSRSVAQTLLNFSNLREPIPQSPFGFSPSLNTIPHNFFDPVPIVPTQEQIAAASTIEVADSALAEHVCSVCQENFSVGEQVRTLTHCGHRFHVLCIDNWFQRNVHCPLCRHDIRDGLTSDVTQELEQMDDETLRRIQTQTYDVSGETVIIETTIYLSGGEDDQGDETETIPYSESEEEGY
jgi:hypothetical protein